MKIVVFADMFLPHVDGVTNSLVHLIKAFEKEGHEVFVVAPKLKGSDKVKLKGIKIVYVPSIPAMVYPELMLGLFSRELFRELRKFSPEIVHVIGPGPVGSIGLFYSKLAGVKSTAAFHGYFMEPEYLKLIGIKNHGVEIAQKMLWMLVKSFYDRADLVITPSQFVKQDLLDHDFSREIVVINNAIDFSNVKLDKGKQKEFIKKFELEESKVVLYVGRVSGEKNIELLIQSFTKVSKACPNSKLLIVGNGPELDNLKQLSISLGLEKFVVFAGEIKNKDLVKKGIFKLAKVFVTTSNSEVQPVSVIEAMSFGLPIVAAKSRGLTEMVSDNGYLADGNNANEFSQKILKILLDDNLQKEMSKKSMQISKQYSISSSAKKHLDQYKKLNNQNLEKKNSKKGTVKSFIKSQLSR